MTYAGLLVVAVSISAPGPSLPQQRASDRDGGSFSLVSPEAEIAGREVQAQAAEKAGRHDEALDYHLRALERARPLGRPRLVAVLLNRTGRTLEAAGRVQDAVLAYESALRALEGEAGLQVGAEIDRLRASRKGYDAAPPSAPPDLYGEDLVPEMQKAESDPALVVKLLVNVGNAYARQPQDGPALTAYERALARPEAANLPVLRAHALANAGEILRRQGQVARAEAMLTEARGLIVAHAAPVERRRVLVLLAGIQRDRGQFRPSLINYRAALDLYALVDDPLGEGRAWAGLGRTQLVRRRFSEARTAYEHAVARATSIRNDELLWHAYWGLGRARRALGDLDGAAKALRQSFDRIQLWRGQLATDEGKVAFLEGARDVADQLIEVHLARAPKEPRAWAEALGVVEEARGRALADLMANASRAAPEAAGPPRPVTCNPRGPPDFPEGYAQLAMGRPPVLADGAPAAGVDKSDQVPFSVVQMAPGIRSGRRMAGREALPARPEPPDSANAAAPPPTPLPHLVFHVLRTRTAVFAVSAGGAVRGHVAKFGRAVLTKRVAALRRALRVDRGARGMELLGTAEDLTGTGATPAETLLRELHRDLVEPLAGELPPDGAALVIEPHDVLWLVPFAALRTADGRWLAERWPILHAPSAAALDAIRATPGPGAPVTLQALVVGNPITAPVAVRWRGLEATFGPLRGAESEARAIAGLIPDSQRRLLVGAEGDLEAIVSDVHRRGIVHLATHGVAFGDDPLDSFVLLGPSRCGQLLTAREATALSLSADLVVLSACQTSLGRITGDGIIGLARAFMVAGARTVLVSQWSVDDASTRELMVEFYQQYLQRGADKATALQRAMQTVRSQSGRAAPRYWAPFMVIGAES